MRHTRGYKQVKQLANRQRPATEIFGWSLSRARSRGTNYIRDYFFAIMKRTTAEVVNLSLANNNLSSNKVIQAATFLNFFCFTSPRARSYKQNSA